MKDLVVLVADRNIEHALRGLLGRSGALGIHEIDYDLFVHPRRDPGCLKESQDFLRPLHSEYRYAMVVFDHDGCGQENENPAALSERTKHGLEKNGWPGRGEVVILVPELEVWVWRSSPHVAEVLGWANRQPPLREWLEAHEHWPPHSPKPTHPKEAMQAALREARVPRSSAIYQTLAEVADLGGHSEPAFLRLTETLRRWFPS